jgi:hypothetical protein
MNLPVASSFALLTLLLVSSARAGATEGKDLFAPPPPTPLDQLTPDGRPTLAALVLLRSHAQGRTVRLSFDHTRLELRDVRFDSLAVGFEVAPLTPGQGEPPGPRSPLPWSAIEAVETRHSNVLPGMVAGAVFLTLAGLAVGDAVLGPEPDAAAIVIGLALPPAGAVLGGILGGRFPRWQHEWPPAKRRSRDSR